MSLRQGVSVRRSQPADSCDYPCRQDVTVKHLSMMSLQILPAKVRTKHVALLDRVGVQDASNQQITVKQVSLMHDDPHFSHEWV